MNIIKNVIIIWSCDDFNTLGLLRQLGSAGLTVFFLVDGKAKYASKSKYCLSYEEMPTKEKGYEYLLGHFSNVKDKPILLTGSDEISIFIDQHLDELKSKFIVQGTIVSGILEKFTDKNTMCSLANDLGFTCPKTKYVKWNSNISDFIYPCIIKPSHQKPGHYNEFKYKICKSEKDLRNILKYVRHDSEFILQEYVQKECDVLVYGARLRDGKTILAGALLRDRLADSGSSSHGLITSKIPLGIDALQIEKFLSTIDYYGLFSFEYGKVKDKAYFFEVNLRNDGTSDYFNQSGANIPLAYVYSCLNLDYSKICTSVVDEHWFIDEVFDIENVFHIGGISYKKWKSDFKEATVFKYFSSDDIQPYKWVKSHRIRQMLQDFILKRFRVYVVFVLDKMGLRK